MRSADRGLSAIIVEAGAPGNVQLGYRTASPACGVIRKYSRELLQHRLCLNEVRHVEASGKPIVDRSVKTSAYLPSPNPSSHVCRALIAMSLLHADLRTLSAALAQCQILPPIIVWRRIADDVSRISPQHNPDMGERI